MAWLNLKLVYRFLFVEIDTHNDYWKGDQKSERCTKKEEEKEEITIAAEPHE